MNTNDILGVIMPLSVLATAIVFAVITYHPAPKVTYFTTVIDKVDVKSGLGSSTACVIIDMYGNRNIIGHNLPCLYLIGETVEVRQWDLHYVTLNME